MFFLVPRLTLFLIVVFVILLGWRMWRRRHFERQKPTLVRLAASLGRSSSRRRRKFR